MTLMAITMTLTLVASHWACQVAGSQSARQILNSGASQFLRDNPSHKSKRDDGPVSREYISNLWSDIESAFKFLEEQPVETQARERSLLNDLQRSRKNEINRLPFAQHNFIRFGKRFAPNQNTQSLSPQSDYVRLNSASRADLQDILSRLEDRRLIQLGKQLSEKSYPIHLSTSGHSSLAAIDDAIDNTEKRQSHSFVRIGKRSSRGNSLLRNVPSGGSAFRE